MRYTYVYSCADRKKTEWKFLLAVAHLDGNQFFTTSPALQQCCSRAECARRVTGPLAQLAPSGIIMCTVW